MHVSRAPLESGSVEGLSLDCDRHALFFDIDGTLIDLAPTPDSVVIDPLFADALEKLVSRLSGAIALVTGRPLGFVEERFSLFSGAVAALHGTEFRLPTGEIETLDPGDHFQLAKDFLHRVPERENGLLVEDKGNAIALHYRSAPEQADIAFELIKAAQKLAGPEWRIQPGKFVFELRSSLGSKGAAVRRLMQNLPFRGRVPIAFGDDLTDVPMLETANDLGGVGIAVGGAIGAGAFTFLSAPAEVRSWVMREVCRT